MKRVGISSDGGKTCHLWVEVDKNDNGRMYFTVINGGWRGSLKDGKVRVTRDRDWMPDDVDNREWSGQICWDQPIPKEHDKGYNAVMWWIDTQLKVYNPVVVKETSNEAYERAMRGVSKNAAC